MTKLCDTGSGPGPAGLDRSLQSGCRRGLDCPGECQGLCLTGSLQQLLDLTSCLGFYVVTEEDGTTIFTPQF